MTPRGGSPQITFRQGAIERDLAMRVGAGLAETKAAVAKRDLERFYMLLATGRQELRELGLARNEAMAICDVLNGTVMPGEDGGITLNPISQIAAELHDADRLNGLGGKWSVDVPKLIQRLRTLTPVGGVALLDAAERFWREPERDADELIAEVGLVPETVTTSSGNVFADMGMADAEERLARAERARREKHEDPST